MPLCVYVPTTCYPFLLPVCKTSYLCCPVASLQRTIQRISNYMYACCMWCASAFPEGPRRSIDNDPDGGTHSMPPSKESPLWEFRLASTALFPVDRIASRPLLLVGDRSPRRR
eukprot:3270989-Pyramimonas_sp.AAC.1